MGEKTGTNTPAISLPKGGGAIKGVGETFQPNLFTGTGNFSVPIFTSPGRGGFGPQLTLQYSSGNGNGPFGLGWQLSIPRITRKTEKGLPTYTDKDVFVMSGAEDLVPYLRKTSTAPVRWEPVTFPRAGYTVTRYRPRTEGLFARIEKWENPASHEIHWRATTKQNVTSIYGRSASARIADPEDATHVFEWLLEETFDAKGNHILYEYVQEDPALRLDGLHEHNRRYTQAYIRRILYGNTPDGLSAPKRAGPERQATHHRDPTQAMTRHYVFEVLFDYGDLPATLPTNHDWRQLDNAVIPRGWPVRQDPFSTYRAGFEIRTLRRCCERVLMLHHFKEGELTDAPLVKSTNFTYSHDPWAGFSLLEEVVLWGYRKDPQNAGQYLARDMPPVSFRYSQFEPQKQRYQEVKAEGNDLPPRSLSDPNTTLLDIFGDGLPDVVQSTPGGFHYWENRGGARLGRRHPQHTTPAGITLDLPNVAIGDMGGDGLADIIIDAPPMSGFYEATPDGGWQPFRRFESMPSFDLRDANTRLVDLTGDGLADVLVTREAHFLWFRCRGEAGYEQPRMIPRQHNLDEFPDVYFGDPAGRVRLADMTGDGLNDIVMVHDGRIEYWPNLGWGRFGKRVVMTGAPQIGYDFDPRRLFLVDLDGTGCADVVYVAFDRVHFWFNRSGNGFSQQHTIHGTPYTVDTTALQFADFFGTSTACLVWSYDYQFQPGGNYKALDFCGGLKPHLLVEMSNNMGATTRAQYAPSTKFYLEDKKNGAPWVTALPFPVQVLEKTEVIDHISRTKLVTTYKYHHGYYDGREREFRGFGRVDQYDTEIFKDFSARNLHETANNLQNVNAAFHVPPVLTKNWFHTGVYFDENRPAANGQFYDQADMMEAYEKEFYSGDPYAFALDTHTVETGNTPHEAYRALRGALIRSEVYALDGTSKESHPYTVTEARNEVRQLQPKNGHAHAVYLTVSRESVSYHYERIPDDPRIAHQLTLAVDDYGNVTESLAIGYPRRRPRQALPDFDGNPALGVDGKPIPPYEEQRVIKAVYTFTRFINKDDNDDFYYASIPCEAKAFEVHGLNWQWPAYGELLSSPLKPLAASVFQSVSGPIPDEPFQNDPPANLTTPKKRLIEWTRSYFRTDSNPAVIDPISNMAHRLNLGAIESLGLPYESYQATFDAALLQHIYQGKEQGIAPDIENGYHLEDNWWWTPSGRQKFEPSLFFSANATQDPFGHTAVQTFDDYAMLVKTATDRVGNRIEAEKLDYRVLQPSLVKGINDNRSEVCFDALGLVVGTAVMGKATENKGDSLANFVADLNPAGISAHLQDPYANPLVILQQATTRLVYDLHRYRRDGIPNVVATLARETHFADVGNNTKVQHRLVYSDGFGREAQTKVQAEPDRATPTVKRWVGTGWTVFNNKGKPVRQYEPLFTPTHDFQFDVRIGVSPTLFYDALQRVVCTLYPNHTYEKVVFDPWRQETWDANDTIDTRFRYDLRHSTTVADPGYDPVTDQDVGPFFAGLSRADYWPTWYGLRMDNAALLQHWPDADQDGDPLPHNQHRRNAERDAAVKAARHAGTPTIMHLDTLGRAFLNISDNGVDGTGNDILIRTCLTLDIEGNTKEILDPRKITAFKYHYDLAGRQLWVDSKDAGLRGIFVNVAGNPIYGWDAVGRTVKTHYDAAQRPLETWVQESRAAPFILREKTHYGEAAGKAKNHCGKVWKTYDGAGLAENAAFDFKGNLIGESRTILTDGSVQVAWASATDPRNHVWSDVAANNKLDLTRIYGTETRFDALNRVTTNVAPDGTEQHYVYNEASLLNSLAVKRPGQPLKTFVKNIDYNAKGQREKFVYENNVRITYSYDEQTYRLLMLRTTRSGADPRKLLQGLHYAYDPVGNITWIRDEAQPTVWHRNNAVEPTHLYDYDPTYRLISATGREHEAMTPCHYRQDYYKNSEFLNDTQALLDYTENYEYDLSGNITLIKHQISRATTNRIQSYANDSNRIQTSRAGCVDESSFVFPHDANGNIEKMPHLRELKWNYKNQLVEVELNLAGNRAFYQYDSAGQRVRKYVVKNNESIIEERLYLGGYEIFVKRDSQGAVTFRRDTHHIMDDKNRVALIELEVRTRPGQPAVDRTRLQLSNHLGSAVLEVEDSADAIEISYEEYYPHGGTAYLVGPDKDALSRKRYRYNGKERDDETGFYYYGARYYATWICRWTGPDPLRTISSLNLYMFAANNPYRYLDPYGASTQDVVGDADLSQTTTTMQANSGTDEATTDNSHSQEATNNILAVVPIAAATCAKDPGFMSKLGRVGRRLYIIIKVFLTGQGELDVKDDIEPPDTTAEENVHREVESESKKGGQEKSGGSEGGGGDEPKKSKRGLRERLSEERRVKIEKKLERAARRESKEAASAARRAAKSGATTSKGMGEPTTRTPNVPKTPKPGTSQRGFASVSSLIEGFFYTLILLTGVEIIAAGVGWDMKTREEWSEVFQFTRKHWVKSDQISDWEWEQIEYGILNQFARENQLSREEARRILKERYEQSPPAGIWAE